MKTLSTEQLDYLKSIYSGILIQQFISPENKTRVHNILTFIEKYKGKYKFQFEQCWFSKNGFSIFKLGDEYRLFCNPLSIMPYQPIDAQNAEGDWQTWLRNAVLIKKITF